MHKAITWTAKYQHETYLFFFFNLKTTLQMCMYKITYKIYLAEKPEQI